MKKLWVASIVLATLGSVYPFNFQIVELDLATIGAFLQSCCKMPGRGDVLGNVILFVPIGFTGTLLGFAFVAIVELAQTRLVGHTPEIIDPLLVVFAALTILALAKEERKSELDGSIDTVVRLRVRPTDHFERWVSQTVNLRAHQLDILVQPSQEMGVSVSSVTRRVIEQFIRGLENEGEPDNII